MSDKRTGIRGTNEALVSPHQPMILNDQQLIDKLNQVITTQNLVIDLSDKAMANSSKTLALQAKQLTRLYELIDNYDAILNKAELQIQELEGKLNAS